MKPQTVSIPLSIGKSEPHVRRRKVKSVQLELLWRIDGLSRRIEDYREAAKKPGSMAFVERIAALEKIKAELQADVDRWQRSGSGR